MNNWLVARCRLIFACFVLSLGQVENVVIILYCKYTLKVSDQSVQLYERLHTSFSRIQLTKFVCNIYCKQKLLTYLISYILVHLRLQMLSKRRKPVNKYYFSR